VKHVLTYEVTRNDSGSYSCTCPDSSSGECRHIKALQKLEAGDPDYTQITGKQKKGWKCVFNAETCKGCLLSDICKRYPEQVKIKRAGPSG